MHVFLFYSMGYNLLQSWLTLSHIWLVGAHFSWLLSALVVFESFLAFWHELMFQAGLVYFLPQTWYQVFLFVSPPHHVLRT